MPSAFESVQHINITISPCQKLCANSIQSYIHIIKVRWPASCENGSYVICGRSWSILACPTAQSGQVLRWLIYKVKPWFVVSYPNSVAPVRNFHRKRRHRDGRSNFADARYMLYIIARCVFSCLKLVSPISVLLCSLLLLLTRTSTDTNMNFILIFLFNARKTHCIFRLLLIKQCRVFNICFRHINCYSKPDFTHFTVQNTVRATVVTH